MMSVSAGSQRFVTHGLLSALKDSVVGLTSAAAALLQPSAPPEICGGALHTNLLPEGFLEADVQHLGPCDVLCNRLPQPPPNRVRPNPATVPASSC